MNILDLIEGVPEWAKGQVAKEVEADHAVDAYDIYDHDENHIGCVEDIGNGYQWYLGRKIEDAEPEYRENDSHEE